MNKETYLRLPNITVGELQNVIDYLEENNIKYIEYYENEYKLENALDEIEKYVIENSQYWDETGLRYWKDKKDEPHDILEIIKKAKGDVKNENN